MRDDHFEWDDRKAAANLKKHKVSFEAARRAFGDRGLLEELDDAEDYGEERFLATGMVNGELLRVSYTLRGERIRIISARGATRNEQDQYFAQT